MGSFADPEHELSPEEVKERLDRGEVQLVDVREPHEWDAARIAGARHIALAELTARAGEVAHDRPVVFMCHVGARSAMATDAFRAAGWEAYNLEGGISRWAERGLPVEPAGARVPSH